MREKGFLDAREMARTFDWMRSSDLIWSYVINNWFKGKEPPAFDILAWNNDSTRMPVEMHSEYLRACYLHNAIVKPGAFTIGGTPIDLGKITAPLYVLGAENDHIAPWHATYLTTQHVGGESKYVLTNSGHIAGIVNPPGGKKTWHYTRPAAEHGRIRRGLARGCRPQARLVVGRLGRLGRRPRRADARAVCDPRGRGRTGTLRPQRECRALRAESNGASMTDDDKTGPGGAWRSLGDFIRSQRELANLSMRQLAEIAKISNPYLSQVERGLYKPSADVLKSIANALHISAETMYTQAGLLDESGPGTRATTGSSTRSSWIRA